MQIEAWGLGLLMVLVTGHAEASSLEIFHADSLAGPMEELKAAFEREHQGVTIRLTSGRSQELAERIQKGDTCLDTIRAITEGKANAGIVYYSAAVAAKNDLDIIRFLASVNQSEKVNS